MSKGIKCSCELMQTKRLDISIIEELNDLLNDYSIISNKLKRKRVNRVNKKSEQQNYYTYNQLCTCVIRIRDTVNYINELKIEKNNTFNQAFNFYELINCFSIIYECVDRLFYIFDQKLSVYYGKVKCFVKSNSSKESDISFFKFIRSASSVHPEDTDNYSKITKHKHEFYPYALWNTQTTVQRLKALFNISENDCDIILSSWNSIPSCYNKEYYLYLNEFYEFMQTIISLTVNLIPLINERKVIRKEKNKCKRLKSELDFKTGGEYCLYLRNRLYRKSTNKMDFADGGLLIASHILSNKRLEKKFKQDILENVRELSQKMKIDIDQIGYDDVFSKYDISEAIGPSNSDRYNYISEKFNDYLKNKTEYEILNNCFEKCWKSTRMETDNCKYSNAEWAAHLLLCELENFYNTDDMKNVELFSFADLFEVTLQTVWKKKYLMLDNAK